MIAVLCLMGVGVLATQGSGYELPLDSSMLGLMPFIAGAVALMRKVTVIEKNRKWLLPILSVMVGVALSFVTGQPDPVQSGMAVGVATCYAYDLGKGVVQTIAPPKVQV